MGGWRVHLLNRASFLRHNVGVQTISLMDALRSKHHRCIQLGQITMMEKATGDKLGSAPARLCKLLNYERGRSDLFIDPVP